MVYVMSDIHGQYQVFIKMLRKISFCNTDQLYVIGDVIDRGPNGLKILKYIINHENMTLVIGNHEHMMLEYYKNLYNHDLDLWYRNGGFSTYVEFEGIDSSEQNKIIDYMKNCPLVIPQLEVNKRSFYLTHANYLNRKSILLYKDAFIFDIEDAVWDRNFAQNPKKEKRFDGSYIVFGHTPTPNLPYSRISGKGKPLISRTKKAIAIDCGMANPEFGQLGCLRLDDFKEYYIC